MHHRLTWNWLKQHPLVQDTSVWAGLVLVIIQSLSHVQLFATPWAAAQKLSVLHLLELAQTHVHRLGDAIQPSHPLSSPSPPAFNLSQHQGLFYWADSSHQVALVLELRVQHQSFQWIFRIDFLLLCTAEQGWFFPAQHGADSGVHSPGELSFNWNIQMALMSALDTWHWPWLGSQADCTIMIDLAQDRALPGSCRTSRKSMRLSPPCEMRPDSPTLCPEQLRFPYQTRKEPRFAMGSSQTGDRTYVPHTGGGLLFTVPPGKSHVVKCG